MAVTCIILRRDLDKFHGSAERFVCEEVSVSVFVYKIQECYNFIVSYHIVLTPYGDIISDGFFNPTFLLVILSRGEDS